MSQQQKTRGWDLLPTPMKAWAGIAVLAQIAALLLYASGSSLGAITPTLLQIFAGLSGLAIVLYMAAQDGYAS